MKKLLSIVALVFAVPLLVYADANLQPPTIDSAKQNDTLTQTDATQSSMKSPESDQKSSKKDNQTSESGVATDGNSSSNPIIPPTNNLNDSPGP